MEPDSDLGVQQKLQGRARWAPGDEAGRFIVGIAVGTGHQASLIILDTAKEDELADYKPCTANHLYSSIVLIILVLVSLSLPAQAITVSVSRVTWSSYSSSPPAQAMMFSDLFSVNSHCAHASMADVLVWWWIKLFLYIIYKEFWDERQDTLINY